MNKLAIVQTEPKSPWESLWRQFPQISNSTCVSRIGTSHSVIRTFRLLDGSYVTIRSTKSGDELKPTRDQVAEKFEEAWRIVGPQRAIQGTPHNPTGMVWASEAFHDVLEDLGYEFWEELQ